MSNRSLPSDFVRTVLHNGVGRYVCQLQRLTFKFCKSHGSSRGVREYIERDLVDFARQNPGVVVYLKPRRHRSPCLYAEYLNGETEYISCRNVQPEEVGKWVEYLRTRSGLPIVRLRQFWHTDTPSIQGVWTPFTNMPAEFNLGNFPKELFSEAKNTYPTATEQLLSIAEQLGQQSGKS